MNELQVKALLGELLIQIANLNGQVKDLNEKLAKYEADVRTSDQPSIPG